MTAVITKNTPQSPFSQSTSAPELEANKVRPAVPMEASTPSFLRRISEEHTLAVSSSSQFGVVDHEDCHDTQRREEDAHASTQHMLPRASFH